MDKDKLIDMLFARKESLEKQISKIEATIEKERKEFKEQEESMRKHAERMEKCVLAAERRAENTKKERIKAEQHLIDHYSPTTALTTKSHSLGLTITAICKFVQPCLDAYK